MRSLRILLQNATVPGWLRSVRLDARLGHHDGEDQLVRIQAECIDVQVTKSGEENASRNVCSSS